MNYITWIIIILIVIAVVVAAGKETRQILIRSFECSLGRILTAFSLVTLIGEIVVKYLSHFGSEGDILF